MTYIALALLLGIAGICCLYGAWSRRAPRQYARWSGWALLLLSGAAWIKGTGAEFGITLLFLVPPLAAWALVARHAQWRDTLERKRDAAARNAPAQRFRWLHHAALLLIAIPLSGAAAIYFSIGMASLLPLSALSRTTVAVLSMPVLWGCAAYWAGSDEQPLHPALGIAAMGLAGAAIAHLPA